MFWAPVCVLEYTYMATHVLLTSYVVLLFCTPQIYFPHSQAKQQEADERKKRRALQLKYKQELAEQVKGREHLYHYVGRVRKRKYASMSDREKALNRSLIRKIRVENPELLVSPPRVVKDKNPDDEGYESDGGVF